MAEEPANDDAESASGEPFPEPVAPPGERPLWVSPQPRSPRSSLGRTVFLCVAFLAPCAVIALSIFFIVKGGAPQGVESARATGAPVPGPTFSAPSAVEPDASSRATLETPAGVEVVLPPGFEDEGSDEPPSPAKRAVAKHFATVQEAAAGSCSTESVDGLSRQIIEQARCLKPNDFAPLPKRPNLQMAAHVYPYLELGARDHLLRALAQHTATTMTINSCLRTVAQQYLVSRWAVSKTCGVQLATPPGESNHEIGTALDIAEAAQWRPALEAEQFRWLGTSDKVHFDYKGASGGTRSATDVLAFQKLWNKNHPDDAIAESGRFDSPTEQRLKKSPPKGFAIGPSCSKPAPHAR